MTKRSSRRGSRKPRANPKPKVTFGPMQRGAPGNGGEMSFGVNVEFGNIRAFEDTVWSGMSRRYVTSEYQVDIFGFEGADDALNHEKIFEVKKGERSTATLGRAKDYVREFIETHADAVERSERLR